MAKKLPPRPSELRHQQILEAGSLLHLLEQPDGEDILRAEAEDQTLKDPERLVTVAALDHLLTIREASRKSAATPSFLGSEDVFIIPGFMGSALRDERSRGLIWISPSLLRDGGQIGALRLDGFRKEGPDQDADPSVRITTPGAVPAIYDVLWADLNVRGYNAEIVPFDWRKDLERSATLLADRIRNRIGRNTRPLHLIAHSQGSLVARRAIQILGAQQARALVRNLVLLGPASFGTFAAAFAIAGSHESFATARKYGVKLPPEFPSVFQSFTGLYQLLPWNTDLFEGAGLTFKPEELFKVSFWKTGYDTDRLKYARRWVESVDSAFFNERTSIILGDQPTVGEVKFDGKVLKASGGLVQGDGTVPDFLARLPGVERTFRASQVDHMTMPMHLSVLSAVRALLRGDIPATQKVKPALAVKGKGEDGVPVLKDVPPPARPAPSADLAAPRAADKITEAKVRPSAEPPRPATQPPACRQLQVFSFDPILTTSLETLPISRITIPVPWEGSGTLKEGPVGEYVEVIDYDPASECFYTPVDLTHEHLTSNDGLDPSEADPQFHQQMVYAVSMATISTFEKALGRAALWAPRLIRNADGEVIRDEYVPRLRIYPHALREANAFYDPDRHALLFGYFPSRETPGGKTLPGGTVFACQSFDIIAHETSHALLHGLHRYLIESSNPDVHAFHEAFSDVVAMFQHFSHVDVVKHHVARVRGDLRKRFVLGELAQQFGLATGEHRGALRQYVATTPDPSLLRSTHEPHDRGAILVAALFQAFQNIYEERSRDLYRIATGGTGVLPDGDLHPDLVTRLAIEATKSARHILNMCIRALDYVPPVDLTFGEYLRALITADYDLVRNDDRGYRVAVIDAFRSWGIYPSDVNVLDETALLWNPPATWERYALREVIQSFRDMNWRLRSERRNIYDRMNQLSTAVRRWVFKNAKVVGDDGESLGIMLFGKGYQSIPRNTKKPPLPKFKVESVRPCLRIGPDGEQRQDIVVEVVQKRAGFFNEAVQAAVDAGKTPWAFTREDRREGRPNLPYLLGRPDFWLRGGCTLLIDPDNEVVRYCIRKSVQSDSRLKAQRAYERAGRSGSTAAIYSPPGAFSPFAMLHAED